jgi:hypothetical protein
MCDVCGSTTRSSTATAKVKLPLEAVPDVLRDVGSGGERSYDLCGTCQGVLAEMLDRMIARRFGTRVAPDEAAT